MCDRPAGRQLLARVHAALAAGVSPTIIVTKVDRLGRDTVDVSQTVSLFESMGARIVFLDINVDTRTAMGRAFMQIAAVFAELERARIRERIQTTLDLKRSQNLVIGTVPYGWDARPTGAPQQGRQAHPRTGPQRSRASHHFGNGAQENRRRQPLPDRQRSQPPWHPTKRRGERSTLATSKASARSNPPSASGPPASSSNAHQQDRPSLPVRRSFSEGGSASHEVS